MLQFRTVNYSESIPTSISPILVAVIGGTNSNFGIFDAQGSLLISLHYKSQEITSFTDTVRQTLDYLKLTYNFTISSACFAIAGLIDYDRMHTKPTNLNFKVNIPDIKGQTDLSCIKLANDFEVIGYGLSRINPQDIVQVKQGALYEYGNKVILGAGTGLGKCTLIWNHEKNRYMPLASEAGHTDAAIYNQHELDLVEFIKEKEHISCPLSWEDLLSGRGIQRIYSYFVSKHNNIKQNDMLAKRGLHPDQIFASRSLDDHSWRTYELYATLYGRCAKNFALDSLPRGGIYIAGGIAAHNLELFKQDSFINELDNCGKQQEFIRSLPCYVITDYNVSLYGAYEYLRLEGCL